MEFGRDIGDNFTFKDISSRWYQENHLENNDKNTEKNSNDSKTKGE